MRASRRHNWHVREWPKTAPASGRLASRAVLHAARCSSLASFCRQVKCIARRATAFRRLLRHLPPAPMLPEAPVASREATALPGYLTCLPGRAAWGVRLTAPHVKDYMLACWRGAGRSGTCILVLTGPDRGLLSRACFLCSSSINTASPRTTSRDANTRNRDSLSGSHELMAMLSCALAMSAHRMAMRKYQGVSKSPRAHQSHTTNSQEGSSWARLVH